MQRLALIDWLVIAAYFLLVFTVATWATRRGRRGQQQTSSDYFLAGRHTGWFVAGASLFASNIGSEHVVGLAGTGAASGVAVAQFEVIASFCLLLLGWLFVPFYLRSGVFTMPEFLERRYSAGARWYLALVSILAYVLAHISVTIAAGGIIFEALMGINFWLGALVVVGATGAYTMMGGLRAVLYTDMMQVFVLITGSVTATAIGLSALGGWGEMARTVGPDFLDMWKPASDPAFPWTGVLFGAPILGIWYWCTDQFIVQRVLSARDQTQARRATLFAGFLKLLPLFLFVVPGIIAHALVVRGQMTLERPDLALPTLVRTMLPAGLRGVVIAGMLAALMGSLSSVFNSCSTLITLDVYKKFRPQASERRLVWVGRASTGVLVALGLCWIPLMRLISGQIYQYLQSVQAYISPPIAAVFLVGILWPRANARGALAALLTGFVLGTLRLVAELNKASLGGLALAYAEINFLHFAVLLFAICVGMLVVASLTAPAPSLAKLEGLTFATAPRSTAAAERGRGRDVAISLGLVACVIAIWLYFS